MRTLVLSSLALAVCTVVRAQTPLFLQQGNHADDQFGAALCVTDDLEGDGVPDVLIGAPALPGSSSEPGYARVMSGKDGHVLLRLLSPEAGIVQLFGASVAASLDVDNDGLRDLIVGSPGSGPGAGFPRVQIFASSTGKADGTFLGGAGSWTGLGKALADLGDQDGDGAPDCAMSAPSLSGDEPGTVYLFTTACCFTWVTGDAPGDLFGFAVAGAGDVDLDGVPDTLIGAPGGDYARVVSGADHSTLLTLPGAGGDFASAVSAAGDIDGNGVPDLAVAAPLFNRVDILSGVDGGLLRRFEKVAGEFGRSIAPLGDVNDDLVPDLLVGAPADAVLDKAGAGTAFVISGATGQNLFKFTGHAAGAHLGTSAAAGDLDGDGRPEFLLGAPGDLVAGGTPAGTANVYAGILAGSMVSVGIGCPDGFLITPKIDCFGDPLPNGELTLSITQGLGGASAALLIGVGTTPLPLSSGCIVWINPLQLSVGLVLDGDFPGTGNKTLVGRLPADTPPGFQFGVQALILGFGEDEGLAGTSAIVITVP